MQGLADAVETATTVAEAPVANGHDAAAVETTRPEHIPAKFWDETAKIARVDDMGKGYSNLEKLLSKKAKDWTDDDKRPLVDMLRPELEEKLKAELTPKVPDKYEWPEEAKAMLAGDDDPKAASFLETAKEAGLSDVQFSALTRWNAAQLAAATEAAKEAQAKELAQIAPTQPEQLKVLTELKRALGADNDPDIGALFSKAGTAAEVRALQKLAARSREPVLPKTEPVGEPDPQAKIDNLMKEHYGKPSYNAVVPEIMRLRELIPGGGR